MEQEKEHKLRLLATRAFKPYDEMYKVVDFLNKHVKDKGLMVGLSKDNNENTMVISIYEF